jgi:hypothetical protein
MKEIKEHPWYLKDLPSYLQTISLTNSASNNKIDEEIVDRLNKVNKISLTLFIAKS